MWTRLVARPWIALAVSVVAHVALGLALGLWICPWFETLTPDVRGVVDVDMLVVAEKSKGGSPEARPKAQVKPPQAAPKTAKPPKSEDSIAARPAQTAQPAQNEQPQQPDAVVVEGAGEGGGPRTLSVAEYLKWVRDHNQAPAYPRIARIRGEQGRVVVRVVVAQSGSPLESAEIESSSGSETLDRVALEAARSWRFPPFKGASPRLAIAIPFKFSLD